MATLPLPEPKMQTARWLTPLQMPPSLQAIYMHGSRHCSPHGHSSLSAQSLSLSQGPTKEKQNKVTTK